MTSSTFFKRQTGIENHTEQLDGFGEAKARPRNVYTSGQVKLWQPFARAKHDGLGFIRI